MNSFTSKLVQKILPFKSQKNQDAWIILEMLPFKFGGFFLDLASADGILHSNTYVLEKVFKWKGICIEPNPQFFKQLSNSRKCILVNSAISDKEETVDFRIDNGQLGGIVSEATDNNYRVRGNELANANIIKIKTNTLLHILEKNNAPKIIDYFSLDIEGSEEAVLKSFDFSKYIFRFITIERPTPLINEILFSNGYKFVKNYNFDSFYVHESMAKGIKCDAFEQIPPKNW